MEEDDFDVCRHLGLWDGQAWPGCFLLWVFGGRAKPIIQKWKLLVRR